MLIYDRVVPSTWASCECGYNIARGGCLSLDAHSSSLGAPGSHGSDSFLHPRAAVSLARMSWLGQADLV